MSLESEFLKYRQEFESCLSTFRLVKEITVDTDPKRPVRVDGVLYQSEVLPKKFLWEKGEQHRIEVEPTSAEGLLTYMFVSWNDGLKDTTRTITVDSSLTLFAKFFVDYSKVYMLALFVCGVVGSFGFVLVRRRKRVVQKEATSSQLAPSPGMSLVSPLAPSMAAPVLLTRTKHCFECGLEMLLEAKHCPRCGVKQDYFGEG